jgi:membrane protease YdiL (CAAX protease family)
VGIPESGHVLEGILAGEVAFLVLVLVYGLALRAFGVFAVMRTAANRGNLRAWPRGRRDKWISTLCFMVLNPFNEELVMRGILIHQWGLLLGSPILPIALGFALNATMHGYQGARLQAWHALFFATAVYLLYSPWGLTAAITAHVLGDVFPFLYLRHNLRRARIAQSRKFQAAK